MRLTRALRERLKLRLKRRALQIRAWWKARELTAVSDKTARIPDGPVAFVTLRNEAVRLPWFLNYYRDLGVVHFCVVDNGSTDGSPEYLAGQPDVSLWSTRASYRASRFGMDWLNALLSRYGVGRWVLVIDPDEFLVYPNCDTRSLMALTRWLSAQGRDSFGTMLLDLYGEGTIGETYYLAGEDPVAAAPWFDANNYTVELHGRYHNLWIQGGPRQRVHFADRPETAPALNKIPLVRWRRGYVFLDSTHNLLPRRLNRVYEFRGGSLTSGVLLHTKFLDVLVDKVAEEMTRREHYDNSAEYRSYAAGGGEVRLWTEQSQRYQGWAQLCDLGLMARGGWL